MTTSYLPISEFRMQDMETGSAVCPFCGKKVHLLRMEYESAAIVRCEECHRGFAVFVPKIPYVAEEVKE